MLQELFMVHYEGSDGHFFAHGKNDLGEGVLCLRGFGQLPAASNDLEGPTFVGEPLYMRDLPSEGTKLVCDVTLKPNGRFFADAWTPWRIWDAACRNYRVLCYRPDKKPEVAYAGSDLLTLSTRFPTDTWDRDGTIWRSGACSVRILECILADGATYEVVPSRDPRVPMRFLGNEYAACLSEFLK